VSGPGERVPAGILCAMVTPFDRDGGLDRGAARDLVDFLVGRGVHGLFVLGTTGEGPLLPPSDRRAVAEAVVELVAGRLPVVVHVGAPDTATAASLARHAEGLGVAGVATVAPYYFAYGEEELFRHFASVAEAAPHIEHYLYENPERVGYSLGPGLVGRVVREVPGVVGVKDTGDSLARLVRYLAQPAPRPRVYTGNNLLIHPALSVGARGAVSALANAVPELVVSVYEAWASGRFEESLERQLTLARFASCLSGLPYVGAVKHVLGRRGVPGGWTRAPQPMLRPDQARELDRRLSALEELAPWLEPAAA
jgi:dihydrodipicolinate synthase/N-acetylneuraminate lyase